MDKSEILKIAIIRRNGFGDLVISIELINYFIRKCPFCQITLFKDRRNSALAKYIQHIHKHVTFRKGNKCKAFLLSALKYRNKFDIVVASEWAPMKGVNFFVRLLGAKASYAYVKDITQLNYIRHGRVFDISEDQHVALNILQLLSPELKQVPANLYPELKIPNSVEKNIRMQLLHS